MLAFSGVAKDKIRPVRSDEQTAFGKPQFLQLTFALRDWEDILDKSEGKNHPGKSN